MLKLVDKFHTPLSLAISRRSSLFKNEDTNYVSAFLTSVRQKLLPFHSKSLKNYPSKSELEKIYSEIYKEVNELYIDEHDTIGNNDYLEQTYDIFSNIHKLVRKYEIVYDIKLEENRKKFFKNDPNDFPVYNLTGSDLEPDYKTIMTKLLKAFAPRLSERQEFDVLSLVVAIQIAVDVGIAPSSHFTASIPEMLSRLTAASDNENHDETEYSKNERKRH